MLHSWMQNHVMRQLQSLIDLQLHKIRAWRMVMKIVLGFRDSGVWEHTTVGNNTRTLKAALQTPAVALQQTSKRDMNQRSLFITFGNAVLCLQEDCRPRSQ